MRLEHPDGRALWLAYGMNVHAGGDPATTARAIQDTVLPLRARLGAEGPFGLAVRWSAAGVRRYLEDEAALGGLRTQLAAHDLVPFTGNAFVHGEFHGRPLKDAVYRPPWSDPARVAYTLDFARVLASLRAPGEVVSLSTAPGSWRAWAEPPGAERARAEQLLACAQGLAALERETGVCVRLGLEPEPRCTLETTQEAIAFFTGPWADVAAGDTAAGRHVGLCFDVCHQAVAHEDIAASLAALADAGVAITKLQASCALELPDPADEAGRAALERFAEPVYLHQVGARAVSGAVTMVEDLPAALDDASLRTQHSWRVHFHVPVFRDAAIPPLRTTRDDLEVALAHVATHDVTPHIEIETYTWDVIPDAEREAGTGFDLVEALAREYGWVLGEMARYGFLPAGEVTT